MIPALRAFPDDALITADDDIIYAHNWFELLKTEHERYPLCIVFHRAHKVYADKDNPRHPLPYRYWGLEEFPAENESSDWFFPTGGAGALYPPGSLHPVVSETAEFQALAPTGDDIWFWACAKLQKTPYRYIPNGYRSITSTPMPDGDRPLLFINVVANGNNTQITALCARFPELGDAVETFPRKKVDLREMWRVGCWEVRKGIEKVVGKKAYAFLKRLYAQVVLKRKEM
ncbi:MAG: hypothetical protein LBP19_07110 [Treponema sp.]|nr:hypothetical protein [Treponema sp.]